MMEKRGVLVAIVVAAIVALGVAAYAYTAMKPGSSAKPVAPTHPPHPGPWSHKPVAHPPRHKPWLRHHGPRLVLSDEFKKHVLEILMSDNRTATLLREGYNVTAIKPIIQGVVEGDGTVTLHAVKAVVVLREKNGNTRGAALVVVDLVNNKVVKIIEHETTVWSQQG